ncbi:MAG: hypothetical protein IPN67_19685 [Bacteroidales bacterium]|nr:hypothetical protein [Bacteroidales bacterium]
MISDYSNLKYFKGEKKCPKALTKAGKELFWLYEMKWVEFDGDYDGFGEYEGNGLSDFEKDDGVPLTLKRLLFNRYMHWSGYGPESIPDFKEWYIRSYRG